MKRQYRIARFEAVCPTCGSLIEEGDKIAKDNEAWVHEECVESERVRPW